MRPWIKMLSRALAASCSVLWGCSHEAAASQRAMAAGALAIDFHDQYHECVPLGWKPVPVVRGYYYPGYSVTVTSYLEWLDAIWRGRVSDSELQNPNAKSVVTVLDALVNAGLLSKTHSAGRTDYFMTQAGISYFYASDRYDDNRSSMPYLCYSQVELRRILWMQPIHFERNAIAQGKLRVFHAAFDWVAGARAAWANDPILRAHSVILPPVQTPAVGKFGYVGGQWRLLNVDDRGLMLPVVARQSAWVAP